VKPISSEGLVDVSFGAAFRTLERHCYTSEKCQSATALRISLSKGAAGWGCQRILLRPLAENGSEVDCNTDLACVGVPQFVREWSTKIQDLVNM
jgi:hypothetical protein